MMSDLIDISPIHNSTEQLWEQYQREPTTENYDSLVKGLQPIIRFSISRSAGGLYDPVINTEALTLTNKAIQSYKPEGGAKLTTHIVNQLQPLSRKKRERAFTVKVPEKQKLNHFTINTAIERYKEAHNDEEPSLVDIADITGLSTKRIKKVLDDAVGIGTQYGVSEDSTSVTAETDFLTEAMDYVYLDEDAIGKKIMKHSLGYSAAPQKTVRELGAELGISPATISRRAEMLVDKIQKINHALER